MEKIMNWFHGKRVVVPFDFSGDSINAVKMALKLADRADEVHVAHVLLELPATDPIVIWDEFSDERRRKTLRESMEKTLADSGIEGVQVNVSVGNPGRVIADLAEEIEAGLIVIPSHGYTGLKRWFLGSVAERVVHLAKCPVLVLKS
jgi:nucleotide-binding universal stress UspA family protein